MARRMTLGQIEMMQPHSAAAIRSLQGDDDLADEVEDMSPEEFAEWRDIEIVENPLKRANRKEKKTMPTIRELRADLREQKEINTELEDENQALRDRLAEIQGLASVDDGEEDDDDEDSE